MKPSKLGARKQELAKKCGVDPKSVRWVSAAKGNGIPELRSEIHTMLNYEPEYEYEEGDVE